MAKLSEPAKLSRLMEALLSAKNAERLTRVFYDAAKIVHQRQKCLNKSQLKMKEVSSALVLAESLHSQHFRFEATGELAENFGTITEAEALKYYEEKVMGEVKDVWGRTIVIDEDGMRSLYKEAGSGKHVVAPENYEEGRGKRLPWIRYALERSEAVYLSEETIHGVFRRTYLYTATVSIPLDPKPQVSYYVVVVREGKNAVLRLVTAYSMFSRNKFLTVIALCSRFCKT
jgi:hypothetical protein